MGKKQVTFNDIAKYTNFSKTTVSRYFNHPDTLTVENRETIRRALDELGYHENRIARLLASGESDFVGLIIPNLFISYYSEMLVQILSTYEKYGYKFLVYVSNGNRSSEEKYLRELMSYQIVGLIIMSHAIPSRELADLPVPVVAIEREDEFISSVNCDNYMGAVQAANLLAMHGCEVLIHINLLINDDLSDERIPSYKRILGFQDFCREHNLESQTYIRSMGKSTMASRTILADILGEIEGRWPDRKKGLFVSNDNNANEILNLLLRKYRTFPDDYRIVGFDNSPISQEALYPISTVGQQIDLIACEAVQLLHDQIRAGKEQLFGTRVRGSEKDGPSTNATQKKGTAAKAPVHKVITPVLYRRETTEGLENFRKNQAGLCNPLLQKATGTLR